MMNVELRVLLLVSLAGLFACGDGDDGKADGGVTDIGTKPLESNFNSIYTDLLSRDTCAKSGCHGMTNPSAMLSLSAGKDATHTALMGDTVNAGAKGAFAKLIVAGNPDMSYFYLKLQANPPGDGVRMPQAGIPLSQADQDAIKMWIQNGAANN